MSQSKDVCLKYMYTQSVVQESDRDACLQIARQPELTWRSKAEKVTYTAVHVVKKSFNLVCRRLVYTL